MKRSFGRSPADLARIYSQETGLPLGMTRQILRRISGGLDPDALRRLQKKLKPPSVLGRCKTWAWVAPGNVPDPIALAVVAARLQKAELILKLSKKNERTGRALVRRLSEPGQKIRIVTRNDEFGRCARRADVWVVYGDDATLQILRHQAPVFARWVGHGHRISFSIVFRSALGKNLGRSARACAEDVWLYDQGGCLSPQVIWVESGADEFAERLQSELDRLRAMFGPVRRNSEEAGVRRRVINDLRIRSLNPRELVLCSPKPSAMRPLRSAQSGPVVYRLNRGRFTAPATGQIIAVKQFGSLVQIHREMSPFLNYLQAIGVSGSDKDRLQIQKLFSRSTACYFPKIGRMQRPPIDWQV